MQSAVTQHMGNTLAEDAAAAVRDDLHGLYPVAQKREFLSKILPVEPQIIDYVYEYVVKQDHYNAKTKRWKKFPKSSSPENAFYTFFSLACNAILEGLKDLNKGSQDPFPQGVDCLWVDNHNKVPKSLNREAARVRPDVSLVSRLVRLRKFEDRLLRLETSIVALEERIHAAREQKASKKRSLEAEEEEEDDIDEDNIPDCKEEIKELKDSKVELVGSF